MAGPSTSTCAEWCTEDDLCSPCNDYEQLGPIAADFFEMASNILFELSGRQYPGECSATLRPPGCEPCENDCGERHRLPGGPRATGLCGCGTTYRLELSNLPNATITTVKVDGVTLSPTLYRVDAHRTLVRLADPDGTNPGWPRSQRLDLPDTEVGTWSYTETWGKAPPPEGVHAAAVLACELALACDPENQSKCRLPKTVTSVTREGVTMILSPSDFLDKDGKTGLWEVDLFIRAKNPDRIRRRASVWWPGRDRSGRV